MSGNHFKVGQVVFVGNSRKQSPPINSKKSAPLPAGTRFRHHICSLCPIVLSGQYPELCFSASGRWKHKTWHWSPQDQRGSLRPEPQSRDRPGRRYSFPEHTDVCCGFLQGFPNRRRFPWTGNTRRLTKAARAGMTQRFHGSKGVFLGLIDYACNRVRLSFDL